MQTQIFDIWLEKFFQNDSKNIEVASMKGDTAQYGLVCNVNIVNQGS